MYQRNLKRRLPPRAIRRQARNNARRRRPNIRAQGERISALQAHQPRASQRRERRREDAAGLEEEGEYGAHEHGQVAGEPGHVGQVGVDAAGHQAGDSAADDAVENAHDGEQAGAHEEEGDGGEQQPDGGVGEAEGALGAEVGEEVGGAGEVGGGAAGRGEHGRDVLVGGVVTRPAFQHLTNKKFTNIKG